jgi:SAM-dependent methyltransferase
MGNPAPRQRLTLIEAIEGYYVASVLDFLHREGVLAALAAGDDLASISRSRRFDQDMLAKLLAYASLRCDLVDRVDHDPQPVFRVAAAYREAALPAHLLDQYIGSYGPCLRDPAAALSDDGCGSRQIDRVRHAAAFARDDLGAGMRELIHIVEEFEIKGLLDIGCGGGHLLTDLAQRRSDFFGIGIDANPSVVEIARQRVAKRGLAARVKFVRGDVFDLTLTEKECSSVHAITAVSLVNALFGRSGPGIDAFLALLQTLLPNRILIVCDYYGRLDAVREDADRFRRALIHDVAQSVSGQGVPPNDLAAWRCIYARSSCEIVQAFEGESAEVAWFIHIVQL